MIEKIPNRAGDMEAIRRPNTPYITNWHVITGAPCAGKTTVIKELSHLGYRVVPEFARTYIDSMIAKGHTLEQIKSDPLAFERHILQQKVKVEMHLPQTDLIFLDRAIPDSVAYYQIEGLKPDEAVHHSQLIRYRNIFLFERLTCQADAVRTETDDLAERIEHLLLECYKQLGYNVIRVPVLGIRERTDFILSHLSIE